MLILSLTIAALFYYVKAVGNSCLTSSDCRGGEQCLASTCQCSTNQISYNGRCLTNNNICTGGQQVYFNGQCLYTVQINGQCETSYQCLGGSACFNRVCSCPTGTINTNNICQLQNGICSANQIYYQNQCFNLATVGQQCYIAAQCVGGATCMNGICQCPSGSSLVGQTCQAATTAVSCPNDQVSVNGVCRPRVIPGQSCENTIQCFDAAECSNNRLCVCPIGLNLLGGFCRKLSSDVPCDQSNSVYVNFQCLLVQRLGSNCQSTAQCLGGSECINGLCTCPIGTTAVNSYCVSTSTTCSFNQVLYNSRCYNLASVGQACSVTAQCQGDSECGYSAVCSCPYGTQEVNGQCQRFQDSTCTNSQILINGVCYARVTPNGACSYSQQCLGDSTCVNNICQCSAYSVLTMNIYCVSSTISAGCSQNYANVNGRCLALSAPGSQCENNIQCLGSSTCINGQCACPNGYTNIMSYCVMVSSSTSCATNEVSINGQCFTKRTINEYCVYNEQCQYGTTCQNNFCFCPTGYTWQNNYCVSGSTGNCGVDQVYINGMCYNIAYVGQNCQYTQQCQGNSVCTNNFCQCPAGWTQQGNICFSNSGGATCGPDQVSINGMCYNIAYIGQSCQYAQQCQGGSTCLNNYCQCPAGQVVNNNMCVNSGSQYCSAGQVYVNGQCYGQVQIGQFCYYNQQCLGNSNCTLNTCRCPTGTVVSNNMCVTNSNCRSYQVYVNGQCLDTVSIGMQCTDSSQCIASSSCVQAATGYQRTCQCDTGTVYFGSACLSASTNCPYNTVYVSANNCMQLVSVGQSCSYTSQCMGFAACTNGICQCPYSYTNNNGVCRAQNSW